MGDARHAPEETGLGFGWFQGPTVVKGRLDGKGFAICVTLIATLYFGHHKRENAEKGL